LVVTAVSRHLDRKLVDRLVDAYVDWREECVCVWEANERWSAAPQPERRLAFSGYRAALEREEHASRVYAELVARLAAAAPRPVGIAATVLRALRIAGELPRPFAGLGGSAH
jgi:hypothetical protein